MHFLQQSTTADMTKLRSLEETVWKLNDMDSERHAFPAEAVVHDVQGAKPSSVASADFALHTCVDPAMLL